MLKDIGIVVRRIRRRERLLREDRAQLRQLLARAQLRQLLARAEEREAKRTKKGGRR